MSLRPVRYHSVVRILYATMQYGFGYAQGTERYLSILAAGMRDRSHEVVFLAGDPEGRANRHSLGEPVARDPLVLACPTGTWMAVEGRSADAYLSLLREQRPDVIHVANPGHIGLGLLEAAAALAIPVVVTVMDYWWLCPKHTLHHYRRGVCTGDVPWQECVRCIAATHESSALRAAARLPVIGPALLPSLLLRRARSRGVPDAEIERWKDRRAYIAPRLARAAAVIFPSHTAERLVRPLLVEHETTEPRCVVIPYGLEPHWFSQSEPCGAVGAIPRARAWGSVGERIRHQRTLGFAGALQPHKGPHILLDALHRLAWADARVRIAGSGDPRYERRLRRLARGLNVEFAGRVPPADMPAFLRSLDVLVLPSLWPENLPIVVLEAYAAGVPVIASDVGGIAEIVPAGCLFEPGSAASLAARLTAWREGRLEANVPPQGYVATADEMCVRTLEVYESISGSGA